MLFKLSCDTLPKKFCRFYCLILGLKNLFLASQKICRIVAFHYSQYRPTKTVCFYENNFFVTIAHIKPIQHLTTFGNSQLLS